jgi:hypothetical protein
MAIAVMLLLVVALVVLLVVPLVVLLLLLVGGVGGSVNPVKSFGAAVVVWLLRMTFCILSTKGGLAAI